ncbi:MAG: biotin synthase BioB [Chitinispirillaceae bacterium]|nr:biotin synthase BioB [Chitinispirillaceae bacterium]
MSFFTQAEELHRRSVRYAISPADLDTIIAWPVEELVHLFAAADGVRRAFFNNTVDPCTLMNVKSGGCGEDCAFCAQSARHATGIPVTPLATAQEIRTEAMRAQKNGVPFCVVASGRRLDREAIRHIADALAPVACEKHASLGIIAKEDFEALRRAGIVCYNHNLETSRSFFPRVVTTHTYDQRIATVKLAKASGMRVCCGGIVGLGESWEQRKELCLELRSLDVDTVPINFLNALPGTPVAPPKEPPLEFLKIVAMLRLALPDKTIKVCGGREKNLGPLQSLMFYAGANGYITGGYLTTPGAGIEQDESMIGSLGLRRTPRS